MTHAASEENNDPKPFLSPSLHATQFAYSSICALQFEKVVILARLSISPRSGLSEHVRVMSRLLHSFYLAHHTPGTCCTMQQQQLDTACAAHDFPSLGPTWNMLAVAVHCDRMDKLYKLRLVKPLRKCRGVLCILRPVDTRHIKSTSCSAKLRGWKIRGPGEQAKACRRIPG